MGLTTTTTTTPTRTLTPQLPSSCHHSLLLTTAYEPPQRTTRSPGFPAGRDGGQPSPHPNQVAAMEAMQAAQAAARARYAQAASAFAPLSADNLAPQMQLFIERCETLYGASPP